MGLFRKSSNRLKNVLFIINLSLITLAALTPFLFFLIKPYSMQPILVTPFFRITSYIAFLINESGSGIGLWFFVLFLVIVSLVLCSAILAHSTNKNFSLIVYLFVIVDMLLSISLFNLMCLLWETAIIVLTSITKKEFTWDQ